MGDPDAASTSGLVYILGGCLLALSCGLLGAVRLKHCNKPKPPLHVELGLKKRSEAGPPPKVQRDEDAMRLRRQELGAMAWSSDESDDDEEAQRKDEENRTALFRRQPSSLETRSQKDAELSGTRAEEAERRRRRRRRAGARPRGVESDRGGRGVTSGAARVARGHGHELGGRGN